MPQADGDPVLRSLALDLIRQRHLLGWGQLTAAEYATTLADLADVGEDPRPLILDAVILVAVELVDTLEAYLNALAGGRQVTAEDIFAVYHHDFGIPYPPTPPP